MKDVPFSPLHRDATAVSVSQRCPFLSGLQPHECATFVASGRRHQVQRGGCFFLEGEPATQFYILQAGEVKLTQSTPDGQQVIIAYLGSGDGFGIIVVLGQSDYPVTAEAVQDCVALAWDRETATTLMRQIPQLALNGMELLAERFMKLQKQFRELATERVEQRIARTVLRLVRQFGKRVDAGVLINMPLTHQDLAEMSGTTIYTVSRTLSKWEQAGVVANGRLQLTLCRPHDLVTIAEGN